MDQDLTNYLDALKEYYKPKKKKSKAEKAIDDEPADKPAPILGGY